jgi:hypothetical protein
MPETASSTALLFDWAPHLDRLREEAAVASLAGRRDPWALVEAECWLDLIDAEIAAHRKLPQSRPEVVEGLKQLTTWRGELQLVIRRLKSLKDRNGSPPLAGRPAPWTPSLQHEAAA